MLQRHDFLPLAFLVVSLLIVNAAFGIQERVGHLVLGPGVESAVLDWGQAVLTGEL